MMWHYFPRRPIENRVLKTRFIIQKNFKNLQVPSTRPHGSDQNRERLRSERGRPDKRERNSQIREGEKEIAWVARPKSASSAFFFFFSSFWLCFLGRCWFGIYWVRNRFLETRFPCRRHLEKVPRKRRTIHENRALKTRFRSPKSSL